MPTSAHTVLNASVSNRGRAADGETPVSEVATHTPEGATSGKSGIIPVGMNTPVLTASGLVVLITALAVVKPAYKHAARWFAVAAIGQAATLQMIAAGPLLRYQHYPPLAELFSTHPWSLGIVLGQAILITGALARSWRNWRPSGRGLTLRLGVALLLSVSTAATVSPELSRYLSELAFAATLQVVSLVSLVLMAMAVPTAAVPHVTSIVDRVLGAKRLPVVAAVLVVVVSTMLSVLSYERHPHIPDEVTYLYHSKYFAQRVLTMPAPPVAAAFDVDLMEYEPARWYSPMSPGWPAVLTLGTLAGLPWLVNPLLAGFNILMGHAVFRRLYPSRLSGTATLLLATSPWFLFLGMSLLNHQVTLACGFLAALGIVEARQSGRAVWGLLAGAAIGATSLIRPLDGAIVGLLMGAWAVGIGGARLRPAPLAGLAVGTLAIGSLVFPYNLSLTGNLFTLPVNAYFDKHYWPNANAYGFGPDRGVGWPIDPNPGHSPVDGLINTNLNAFSVNIELFGWSAGSLIFVAWLLVAGGWRREDRLMIATTLLFVAAHFFNYFSGGPDFGARYWFSIIGALVALTASGIHALAERLDARVWLVAAAMAIMTVASYLPWRATDKYYHFRDMRPDLRTLSAERGFGDAIVLIRGNRFPDYASAFAENPADVTSRTTIYAWDRDANVRAEVLRAYADRRVWLIEGPSITGDGFRIVDGPVPAAALIGTLK